MRKFTLFFSVVYIIFISIKCGYGQENKLDSTWINWKFLIGSWQGKSSGDPGTGTGNFSFKFDLDKNILVRNGHTVFPPQNGKPELIHDDIMIVFKDKTGLPNKAIYFDNEGHILNYKIDYPDKNADIILTSEAGPGEPVMRLSYKKIDDYNISVKFEAAMPDSPGSFRVHVEGTAEKVK